MTDFGLYVLQSLKYLLSGILRKSLPTPVSDLCFSRWRVKMVHRAAGEPYDKHWGSAYQHSLAGPHARRIFGVCSLTRYTGATLSNL